MMDISEPSQFGLRQLFYKLKLKFPEIPDVTINDCIRKARYDYRAAETMLQKEAPHPNQAPLKKTILGSPNGLSPGNSPLDGGARSLGGSPTQNRVPPPLPATPPIAGAAAVLSSGPSPPIYTSPLYRPDTDLSLPPPDMARTSQASQIQVIRGQPLTSTSVNVILNPAAEPHPLAVICSSGSTDHHRGVHSQLEITISPPGRSFTSIQQRPGPWQYGPITPSPSLSYTSQGVPSLQDQEQLIKDQCARREKLRLWLGNDRMQLDSLRQKVSQLQEELTREKRLLGHSDLVQHPPSLRRQQAVIDLEQLRSEVRNLQDECQRMYEQLKATSIRQQRLSVSTPTTPPHHQHHNGLVSLPTPPVAEEDGEGWNCSRCTFSNHPALIKCEQCDTSRPGPPLQEATTSTPPETGSCQAVVQNAD